MKYVQYDSARHRNGWAVDLRELDALNNPMTVSHEKFGIPTRTSVPFRFDNLSATTDASSSHFHECGWASSKCGTWKVPGFDNCERVKRMAVEIQIYKLFSCIDLFSSLQQGRVSKGSNDV